MNDIIKLAWRNLWRNRRRTMITATSIFFSIFIAIVMRSFQLGTYGHMIKQSIESFSGYLQIQQPEYFNDPNINHSFTYTDTLADEINRIENVQTSVPRIESFALASNGTQSKGVMLIGISPEKELLLSNPKQKLVHYRFTPDAVNKLMQTEQLPDNLKKNIAKFKNHSYATTSRIELDLQLSKEDIKKYLHIITGTTAFKSSYLTEEDNGVLLSDRLARYLKATVGDTVVLLGQGYHGVSAAGVYPVRGIVSIPSPDLDNKLIYMSLKEANSFLGMQGNITSLAINLKDPDEMKKTQLAIQEKIGKKNYVVKNWEELIPVIKQQIEGDNVSGQIMLGILYAIVFFGIFGTVLMMVAERKREFGMLVAIGMKRSKLAGILAFEMAFLGFIGAASGMLASIPVILTGYYHPVQLGGDMAKMLEDMGWDPVMPMEWFGQYFYMQGIIIIIMVVLACWFPVRSILKLDTIKALRN
ncbi:ABC transporter permease [Saccharicrinis sp. FJH54]|uniref:ABC transporter permease n=1 Tax=Saccharicrinis sp. FJH54 TaxID=3344665 RepID=UPI0035D4FDF6